MTIRQMYYCTRGKTRCNDRVRVMGDFDCGRTDACLLVENDLMKSERYVAKVFIQWNVYGFQASGPKAGCM